MLLLNIDLGNTIQNLIDGSMTLGGKILAALVILIVGRIVIKWVNKLVSGVLQKRGMDPSIQSFLCSLVNVLLLIMLFLMVFGALGIELTGFAALIASCGVAVGMSLSGNLSNLAGGLLILIFKPYKVGDYIDACGTSGTVRDIQIFHTVLVTVDNKIVFAPNGAMSSGVITNYSKMETRRVDFNIGIEYGQDYKRAEKVLLDIIARDARIIKDPAPFVRLGELSDSSINITVRVWVKAADYWDVHFGMTEAIYAEFNKQEIPFAFPTMTIHNA